VYNSSNEKHRSKFNLAMAEYLILGAIFGVTLLFEAILPALVVVAWWIHMNEDELTNSWSELPYNYEG